MQHLIDALDNRGTIHVWRDDMTRADCERLARAVKAQNDQDLSIEPVMKRIPGFSAGAVCPAWELSVD